ncbi:hypothetical protein [[Mycoplasma] testudinis]|uniref:hypothetical protein n=1 Tax=[Mycoplasma] testudinis TaxID=33924 RepID=UPI00146FBFD5|nr:hypothetical protein [[Mycoplasma] testudinis]
MIHRNDIKIPLIVNQRKLFNPFFNRKEFIKLPKLPAKIKNVYLAENERGW